MKMNILVIHEVGWIEKVVYDVHMLAEAMSIRGHNVYAIDYESMWQRDGSLISKGQEIEGLSRALPNSSICLIRPSFIKIGGLSRLSAFVTHYFAIERVIKEKDIDAIILYSVPTNGLQTVYLAKKYGVPIIFRSLDALNQLVVYPMLRPITKFLEKRVYSKVDMALTLTPKLSEYMVGLGADANKVKVLLMTVDTNLFHPANGLDTLRQQWGISESDQVILFMGTLFDFSGLDMFIKELPYVIRHIPNAKLLIVGDGTQRLKLEGIINELGLQERVVITGFQPYQDMPDYINLADVCISSFDSNDVTKDIFPGKIVQFLACGKPLVATALSGVKSIISGEEQGVVYVDNVYEMASVVVGLLKISKDRYRLGNNGLNYVRQVHSCEKVSYQLEAILEQVIKVKQNRR